MSIAVPDRCILACTCTKVHYIVTLNQSWLSCANYVFLSVAAAWLLFCHLALFSLFWEPGRNEPERNGISTVATMCGNCYHQV